MTSYDADLIEWPGRVEAVGCRGLAKIPYRKSFPSLAAFMKWRDTTSENFEIWYVRKLGR